MDLWVVAAAAGAGYLAKYWQNLSQERGGLTQSSSGCSILDRPDSTSVIQHNRDKTFPTCQSAQSQAAEASNEGATENIAGGKFTERAQGHDSVSAKVASVSASGREKQECSGEHGDSDMLSLSHLPPGFLSSENIGEYEDEYMLRGDVSGDTAECPGWEIGISHGFRRSRNSLRSRLTGLQVLKPLSSLDSCVMAQLCKEHCEMGEHGFTSLPSPCTPSVRPFLVSDGRKIISRSNVDSFSVRVKDDVDELHKEVHLEVNDGVVRLPHRFEIGPAQFLSKLKLKRRKDQSATSSSASKSVSKFQVQSQGFPSEAVLFCLGISVGLILMIQANKKEVERLKELLKQTQNLVQDLQEELEMKDSLTVKELVYDTESPDAHDGPSIKKKLIILNAHSDPKNAITYAGKESVGLEEVESMSKIEAELEAELERLELSMKESTLHGKSQNAAESNPSLMAEVVQGELREDAFSTKGGSESVPDRVSSSSSTPHSANYAVSPHELSVRLHEVIQSRLEAQIDELKSALKKSQQRVAQLEQISSGKDLSSPNHPVAAAEDLRPSFDPLVMNLSDEALDAYHEAYEELGKIHVPKEHDASGQNGTRNGTVPCCTAMSKETSEDENENESREEDMLLIERIVQKARQGSPAILSAHKAMVSLDRCGH